MERTAGRERRSEEHAVSPWSLRIATVAGIPIRIHFTFVLLLLWLGFAARAQRRSVTGEIGFILLLFACVVLHELGHAVMARRFAVKTREIVLYPIGGIARLEDMPRGGAELFIALAGPAVNVILMAVLAAVMLAFGIPGNRWLVPLAADAGVVPKLFTANFVLFAFNLIPAFPMDGGRVLRAALSFVLSDERATRIAATVGQGIAILFGAFGLLAWNPVLLLVALFVFLGAAQEASFSARRAVVQGRNAREAMVTRFETLAPQDTLGRAAGALLATHQQDFPVLDAWNRIAGVLPRSRLLAGLASSGNDALVLEFMVRDVGSIGPDAPLDEVLRLLQDNPSMPLMVQDGEQLVGMITLENLAEFIEVARHTRHDQP